MKIYIVTSGCYSDYGINAVFTNKELAEKYCTAHSKYPEEYFIEEYEADSEVCDAKVGFVFAWNERRGAIEFNGYMTKTSFNSFIKKENEIQATLIKRKCMTDIDTWRYVWLDEYNKFKASKIICDRKAEIKAARAGISTGIIIE